MDDELGGGDIVKSRAFVFAAILLMVMSNLTWAAEPDILQFYKSAFQITQLPPQANTLKVLRQQHVDGLNITILSTSEKGVYVGTFTKKAIPNIEKYLTLRVQLQTSKSNGPIPPETIEWVYLFDRNGDGLFDYLCWPVGPLAVKPPDFSLNYPKADSSKGNNMSSAQFNYYIKYMRLVFWHFADDDFNGNLDSAVYSVMDSDNLLWVDKFVAFRMSQPSGTYQGWYFSEDIMKQSGEPSPTNQGFQFTGLGGKVYEFTAEKMEAMSKMLGWFNQVALEYGLPKQ